jgi:N-acetyl sugar amidotransferase
MIRCKKCVMPNTRPDTPFVDGVCSACITHEKRNTIDWDARERELLHILEKTPRNGSGYDCIVPSSGGKDSTWQVLKMIELGVKPLVVTATTCHLTETGRANIDNLARYADTVEFTPNKRVRAALNRAGLRMVGDISWPEHVAIFTVPFRAAVSFGIPTIFYGENPQEAYGGPIGSDEAREMTRRWVSEFGGFLGMRPRDMIGIDGITKADMEYYLPPPEQDIADLGVTARFLGQYYRWDSLRNTVESINAGMLSGLPTFANWWQGENLDNAQTGIHDFFGWLKYGYGRGAAQISVDVREKTIHRETAMDWVINQDGMFPHFYMGTSLECILSRIEMSDVEFFQIARKFANHDLLDENFRLKDWGC